jgi:aspartate oxidase
LHGADTIAAGDGLCDERAIAVMVESGPRYVMELVEWGDLATDRIPIELAAHYVMGGIQTDLVSVRIRRTRPDRSRSRA